MTWGGSRHKRKPFVDVGLLFKAFDKHADLLKDLKGYEKCSRTASPDPLALCSIYPLAETLVQLEPTAEIHGQCVRQALGQLLVHKPEVNDSEYAGRVWLNLRAERITTILNHIRELARDEAHLKKSALVLTKTQYAEFRRLIDQVQLNDVVPEPAEKTPLPIAAEAVQPQVASPKRVLKQELSNVSLDSNGFPAMLQSPEKESLQDAQEMAPSCIRKRLKTYILGKGGFHAKMGVYRIYIKIQGNTLQNMKNLQKIKLKNKNQYYIIQNQIFKFNFVLKLSLS